MTWFSGKAQILHYAPWIEHTVLSPPPLPLPPLTLPNWQPWPPNTKKRAQEIMTCLLGHRYIFFFSVIYWLWANSVAVSLPLPLPGPFITHHIPTMLSHHHHTSGDHQHLTTTKTAPMAGAQDAMGGVLVAKCGLWLQPTCAHHYWHQVVACHWSHMAGDSRQQLLDIQWGTKPFKCLLELDCFLNNSGKT